MPYAIQELQEAIKTGALARVKGILDDSPKLLEQKHEWNNTTGWALNMAAWHDQPAIIEYLIVEKNVLINRQNKAGNTALHHAADHGCAQAVLALLENGADFTLMNNDNETAREKADNDNLNAIVHIIDTFVKENKAQPKKPKERRPEIKLPEPWMLSSPVEIVNTRKLPDNSATLTDVFNFETRRMTTLAKDLGTGHIAISDVYFDDISDRTVLKIALEKLTERGGTAEPCSIERRSRLHKPPVL